MDELAGVLLMMPPTGRAERSGSAVRAVSIARARYQCARDGPRPSLRVRTTRWAPQPNDLPILGRGSVNTGSSLPPATLRPRILPGAANPARGGFLSCHRAMCHTSSDVIYANRTIKRTPLASRVDAISPARMTVPALRAGALCRSPVLSESAAAGSRIAGIVGALPGRCRNPYLVVPHG